MKRLLPLFAILCAFSASLLGLSGCRPEFLPVEITVEATAAVTYNIEGTPLAVEALPNFGGGEGVQPVEAAAAEESASDEMPALLPSNLPVPTIAVYTGEPTPDPLRYVELETAATALVHTVSVGETLGYISELYGVPLAELLTLNELTEEDFLIVGQSLLVPIGEARTGSSLKLIPDSELINGLSAIDFNVRDVTAAFGGYLLEVSDTVEGRPLGGPEIVELVSVRASVHPRLLLAVLEHRTGWVTQGAGFVDPNYPMGYVRPAYEGLYQQLVWAADKLNFGYYGRSEGGINTFLIEGDNQRIAFAPDINDGTAGVQYWLASHSAASYDGWVNEVGPGGFAATYARLFGNPFAFTVDPVWPTEVGQPPMALPWESGVPWYFTGGPHGGWASGSGWAALDFAPDKDQRGCYVSETWVTSATNGVVVYSDFGGVIVDLDGDGHMGTGWTVLYQHVDSQDRIAVGTVVTQGDRIGHASCEGGYSNGTHLHIARRYNGRWVSADGPIPFNLSGWVSSGLGREYDGLLVRGGEVKEACVCAEEINEIVGD